jgi:phage tail sheath protein FI
MAQVSFPGVYIQEVSSGVRTITGVSTSIALIMGRATRGPIGEPRRVLSFADYERTYTIDSAFGEMSDQVRQFFLNGGQQAFIVRLAKAGTADEATVTTLNVEGGSTIALTLEAVSAGSHGNELRAAVDYNTADPERTFNLRLFRETINDSGVPVIGESELHKDLSMDSSSPRFVTTVLAQESAIARVVSLTASAGNGVSFSSRFFTDANQAGSVLKTSIPAGQMGSFRIKVGSAPFQNVLIDEAGLAGDSTDLLDVQNAINIAGVTVTFQAGTPSVIRIEATGADVRIEPGPVNDVTAALGLGLANGGLEIGAFAAARPAPSGYVARLTDVIASNDIARLLSLARTTKASVVRMIMAPTTPNGFTVTPITPAGTGIFANEGTSAIGQLTGVRANLLQVAAAVNGAQAKWRVEVHGLRLAFFPRFGTSQTGSGFTVTTDNGSGGGYNVGADGNIFDSTAPATNDVPARKAAEPFHDGTNGLAPEPLDYENAFNTVEETVDLFNIIVLPKNAGESLDPAVRQTIWSNASVRAQKNRAFLLVDPPDGVTTVDAISAPAQVSSLRNGIVLDHSALYFPSVGIVDSAGTRKTVKPGGTIAGIMARIDASRGVWKAPAGIEAGLRGVVAVDTPMSDEQNGILNPLAINALRQFPEGIVSWGARTMDGFDNSGNTDYKYVPVRRFALFIEESLIRGLRFAVFEPNGLDLWAQIRLAAGSFLNGLFRQGAFAGAKQADAFFVKVDGETTTPTDINLGIVNVIVGFAPLKPAEFVVITIKQQTAQVQV